jgi:putative addiction module component (TIGR02574 family)
MGERLQVPPPGFDELATEEKLRYVEALWDRIAETPDEVEVPGWHRQLVNERMAEYRINPGTGRSWREVRDDLLRDLAAGGKKPRG